jgi:hypothetical protein
MVAAGLLALMAAACSPVSKTVATQRPAATVAPTIRAVASPTVVATAKATTAPATAERTEAATRATTQAPTKAAATAQPTVAHATATSAAVLTPSATELSQIIAVPLGEVQRAGDLEIAALKSEQKDAAGTVKPRAGHHYEFVTVTVTNQGSAPVTNFHLDDFMLYDAANNTSVVVDLAPQIRSQAGGLPEGNLEPGKAVTGVLVFEVPDAAAKWDLAYATKPSPLLWALSG